MGSAETAASENPAHPDNTVLHQMKVSGLSLISVFHHLRLYCFLPVRQDQSHSLNDKKTCVIKRDKCQSVTGIIVNDKVNINSKYKRKIRQEVYYLLKNEKEHFKRNNINDKEKYLIRLLGKINYCLQINPNNQEFIKYKEELIKKINVKGTSN